MLYLKSAIALRLLPQLLAALSVGNGRRSVDCSFSTAANLGDTCESFASDWGVAIDTLKSLNPGLNCDHFDSKSNYCIMGTITSGNPNTTTTSTAVPSTPKATVTTSIGLAENYVKFHKVVSGDQCYAIEAKYDITDAQFSKWNPYIDEGFWQNYYVCIHVPGASTASPQRTPTPNDSQPQMPDITKDYKKFHKVQSGEGCYAIEQENDITLDQFRKWNSYVDAACTNMWAGYYVCEGI